MSVFFRKNCGLNKRKPNYKQRFSHQIKSENSNPSKKEKKMSDHMIDHNDSFMNQTEFEDKENCYVCNTPVNTDRALFLLTLENQDDTKPYSNPNSRIRTMKYICANCAYCCNCSGELSSSEIANGRYCNACAATNQITQAELVTIAS